MYGYRVVRYSDLSREEISFIESIFRKDPQNILIGIFEKIYTQQNKSFLAAPSELLLKEQGKTLVLKKILDTLNEIKSRKD